MGVVNENVFRSGEPVTLVLYEPLMKMIESMAFGGQPPNVAQITATLLRLSPVGVYVTSTDGKATRLFPWNSIQYVEQEGTQQ